MGSQTPVRNQFGTIIGLQPKEEADPVKATLDASLKALGAVPQDATTRTSTAKPQAPQKPSWNALAMGVAVLSIGILVIVLSSGGREAPIASVRLPTALPATPQPQATTIPAPVPVAKLPAFAAPNGVRLGEIEVTRSMVPRAHYGSDWIQANVSGSGLVWLRAADWPALPLSGPNLAPPTPAPQIGRGPGIEQGSVNNSGHSGIVVEPTATVAPAAPTATIVWATSAPVNAADFKQPSMSDTCKFIGCLGDNAVQASLEQMCHALHWQYDGADQDIPAYDKAKVQDCIAKGLYH
jgi:hypothetical protein